MKILTDNKLITNNTPTHPETTRQRVTRPAYNISETPLQESSCQTAPDRWSEPSSLHNHHTAQPAHRGNTEILLSHFPDTSLDNFDLLHEPNFDLSSSLLGVSTFPAFSSDPSFSQFPQGAEWQEPFEAFAPIPDFWPPVPPHDTTINGFDLFDYVPSFDPLSQAHSTAPSTDVTSEQDVQTQPSVSPTMNTPYETHSQDSTSKDCTPPNITSSAPTDRSLLAPRAPLSPAPKSTHADDARIVKRTRNTLAARRYRQKRVEQVADLEAALKESQSERDALKVRVARLEGEVEVLRGLVKQ